MIIRQNSTAYGRLLAKVHVNNREKSNVDFGTIYNGLSTPGNKVAEENATATNCCRCNKVAVSGNFVAVSGNFVAWCGQAITRRRVHRP